MDISFVVLTPGNKLICKLVITSWVTCISFNTAVMNLEILMLHRIVLKIGFQMEWHMVGTVFCDVALMDV